MMVSYRRGGRRGSHRGGSPLVTCQQAGTHLTRSSKNLVHVLMLICMLALATGQIAVVIAIRKILKIIVITDTFGGSR